MEYYFRRTIVLTEDFLVTKVKVIPHLQRFQLLEGVRFEGELEVLLNDSYHDSLPFDLILLEKCEKDLQVKSVRFLQNGSSICLKIIFRQEEKNMEEQNIRVEKTIAKTPLTKEAQDALSALFEEQEVDVISTSEKQEEDETEYVPITITQEVNLTPEVMEEKEDDKEDSVEEAKKVEEKEKEETKPMPKSESLFKESYTIYASFYRVKANDTWESIAKNHQIEVETLKLCNPHSTLKEGTLLKMHV